MAPPEPDSGLVPAVLGFFVDVQDHEAGFAGWEPVAWGLRPWPGRGVVTISAAGPPKVTWWTSVDAAEAGLDTVAGTVQDGTAEVPFARLLRVDVAGSVDGPLLPPQPAGRPATDDTVQPPARRCDKSRRQGNTGPRVVKP